ncbi:MAG: HD domain-containing phosphohydrolase [Kofleriaceae bacterium]
MPEGSRLADLLSALSLATDLGVGAPLETSQRTCLVAVTLGAELGLAGEALATVFYAALMRHLGCTAWAHEAAELVGDDHDLTRTFEGVDRERRTQLLSRAVGHLAAGAPLGTRVRSVARALSHPAAGARLAAAQCAQAEALAADLELGAPVIEALSQMYERYDGRGAPLGLRGPAISVAGQLVHLAQVLEALHRQRGRDATLAELARRRGGQFAPELCTLAQRARDRVWATLTAADPWERVLAAEPEPHRVLAPTKVEDVALAFARFADLKSPHRVGHSTSVAELVVAAARRAGLSTNERARLHIAALLHDLGTTSVSNATWDHPGPLGAAAWEQVRLHAYHGERILVRSPVTRPYAALVGAHHERLDGGGYHRGASGDAIEWPARILAAADAWVALTASRPHRAALSAAGAARALHRDTGEGRLCRQAAALVLAAAGQPAPRVELPAGLTDREGEVLGLVARGLTSKEIAASLGITTRTVKHHIEHIYEKTGVSTRAAAALFAARHNLVALGGPGPNDA